jgi:hypothetical protein
VQSANRGQTASEAGVLPNSYGGVTLHKSKVYPTWVVTRSGHALKGFLIIKKKEKTKKKKTKIARSEVDKYCVNYSMVKHPHAAKKKKNLHDMIRT